MEVSASWNQITAIGRGASCLPLTISSFLARCRKRVASSASPTSAAKAATWRHTPICSSRAAALRWRRVPYPMLLKKEIAIRRPPAVSAAAGGASVQPTNQPFRSSACADAASAMSACVRRSLGCWRSPPGVLQAELPALRSVAVGLRWCLRAQI